jgi:general stress protein CsbA
MVQLCAMLFMFDLFVPGLHLLYKVTLLSQVQHGRMYIGLGFLGVIQLLLILQSLQKLKLKQRRLDLLAAVYAFACLIILIWAGLFTREHYPKFVHSLVLIGAAALFFDIILFCFLSRRLRLGVVLLLILTFASVFHVHPLYRGLGPIYNGDLSKTIDRVSKPGDAWVNLDNLIYENVAIASGRDSLSGVKPYPSLSFWRQVEGPRGDRVYNRYAHVLFSSDPTLKENLHLIGPDSFEVKFACTPFIEKHVQYAMAVHSLNYPCVSEVAEIHYPTTTFYLYKIH